jgi:hypothetical protein
MRLGEDHQGRTLRVLSIGEGAEEPLIITQPFLRRGPGGSRHSTPRFQHGGRHTATPLNTNSRLELGINPTQSLPVLSPER